MLLAETAHRTLGIDLASQPAGTAGCTINWGEGIATVEAIRLGLTDDAVVELAAGCHKVGIDAPFGWPEPFVAFVQQQSANRLDWTPWTAERRVALCYRRTDEVVRMTTGASPLSVSADKIAITSMRCAGLLARLNVEDRSGAGQVVEVYPAVALKQWNFPYRLYKKPKNVTNLRALLAELRSACEWLVLSAEQASLCAQNDHAFDALISTGSAGGIAWTDGSDPVRRPGTGRRRRMAPCSGAWIVVPADRLLIVTSPAPPRYTATLRRAKRGGR